MTGPLLLLHGIGGGAAMFALLRQALGDRVPTLDWTLPGYGDAPDTNLPATNPLNGARPPDIATLADDVVATLDARGIAGADLFGHSIGGMIAQEVAHRHPDRVRRLILSATPTAFGSRDGSFQRRFLAARLAPLDAGRSMAELAAGVVPTLIGDAPHPEAADRARAALAALAPAAYRAALQVLVTFDRYDAWTTLSQPILLIAGGRDGTVPVRTLQRMAQRLAHRIVDGQPAVRLVILDGAGHLAPLERPEAVARAVLDFLSGPAPPDRHHRGPAPPARDA